MYLEMFLGGLLGIIAQSLVKIRNMNKRLPLETFGSVFRAYWKKDLFSVILAVVIVTIGVFVSSEWLDQKIVGYVVANIIKTLFVFAGFATNSIVNSVSSTTERILKHKENNIISILTNKEDVA